MADTIALPLRELFLLVQYATQHLTVRAQREVLYTMAMALQEQVDVTDDALRSAGFPVSDDDDYYSDESE